MRIKSLAGLMLWVVSAFAGEPLPLPPGDHVRPIKVGGLLRRYLVHVPPSHRAKRPMPVVLVLHGAGMNGQLMAAFSGLNAKADEAGFVAVYPNGTGTLELFLTWNAGGLPPALSQGKPDDVAFLRCVLAELPTLVAVDAKRIHATGMSNGGMMCYRLAEELSAQIASIAPVAGTMTRADPHPGRPVSVLHFHGTADAIVPYGGPGNNASRGLGFLSVDQTVEAWRKINHCPEIPRVERLPDRAADGTTVTRTTYGSGRRGGEVVLIRILGGGHTWPGQAPMVDFIGQTTHDISANDLMWEFFVKHPLK